MPDGYLSETCRESSISNQNPSPREKNTGHVDAFTLGRWGWAVNLGGLAYGVTAIVVLSVKTPPNGTSFFDHWLVPISVGLIAAAGLLYLLVARPKEQIREDSAA